MKQPWRLGKAGIRVTIVRQVDEHLPTQQDTLSAIQQPFHWNSGERTFSGQAVSS